MQNNWGVLILLVVAVLIYALVQSRKKPEDDDGGDAEAPEGEGKETPKAPEEQPPEEDELPWEVCQQQLSEEPPIEQSEAVEFPTAGEANGDASLAPEAEVEPVPLSRHAMNSAIRRKAWRLFLGNYRKILPLAAIVILLGALNQLFKSMGILPDWVIFGFGPLQEMISALIAPIVTLGAARAAVLLWRGEAPRVRMLGFFLHEGRYFPALGLILLETLVMIAPAALLIGTILLANKIFQSAAYPSSMGLTLTRLAYAGLLLCVTVYVWLAAWLEMVNYQMARAPKRGALSAFRVGFQAGNRHFGRVVGMAISTGWPYGVLVVAMMFESMWDRIYQTPWFTRIGTILNYALMLLYGGFLLLSMAGLADELLPETGEPSDEAIPTGGEPPCEDKPSEPAPEDEGAGKAN